MKNRKITHVAYNLDTAEIIEANNGNYLKKCVASSSKHNGGRWIYAHGKQAIKRVCQKALAIRKAELAL